MNIVVVNGKRVPVAAYVAAVKLAKALPCATFKTGLSSWWPTTGAEVVEQFRDGVTDRINRHLAQPRCVHGAEHYVLRRIRAGKLLRECAWCGASFQPERVYQHTCSLACERVYRS